MRALANARTNWEESYRKEMAKRKSANDTTARAFRDEYEKYLDQADRPAK